MALMTDAPLVRAPRVFRPLPANGFVLRMELLARATALMFTAFVGVALFCFWVTAVALSPLTLLAWAVLPLTELVRRYANANRRAASRVLGEPIVAPYRPNDDPRWLARAWSVVRDPISWRDMAWLLVHGTIGVFLNTLQVALALSGVFYLIFPFLYWVTPHYVFGKLFGVIELHSVAESTITLPLALLAFVLWYTTAVGLARAEAGLTRALLR